MQIGAAPPKANPSYFTVHARPQMAERCDVDGCQRRDGRVWRSFSLSEAGLITDVNPSAEWRNVSGIT